VRRAVVLARRARTRRRAGQASRRRRRPRRRRRGCTAGEGARPRPPRRTGASTHRPTGTWGRPGQGPSGRPGRPGTGGAPRGRASPRPVPGRARDRGRPWRPSRPRQSTPVRDRTRSAPLPSPGCAGPPPRRPRRAGCAGTGRPAGRPGDADEGRAPSRPAAPGPIAPCRRARWRPGDGLLPSHRSHHPPARSPRRRAAAGGESPSRPPPGSGLRGTAPATSARRAPRGSPPARGARRFAVSAAVGLSRQQTSRRTYPPLLGGQASVDADGAVDRPSHGRRVVGKAAGRAVIGCWTHHSKGVGARR
jgi:hypothetical protein